MAASLAVTQMHPVAAACRKTFLASGGYYRWWRQIIGGVATDRRHRASISWIKELGDGPNHAG
jgi:hypothetical protein